MDTQTKNKTRLPSRRVIIIILSVLVIAAVITSIVFYTKYRSERDKDGAAQRQLVEKLDKVIQLPAGTPAVVTIADKSKLKNQALASRVDNNDMLLIYNEAKRIIVYRPSSEKVIDMLAFQKADDVQPQPTR